MTPFTYNAFVTKVVDGDTFDTLVDLGFGVSIKIRYRLNGIDTAEKNTELGKQTKEFSKQFLEGKKVILKSYKPDKYGRYLCEVYLDADSKSLNQILIESNLAKVYHGESKDGLWAESELTGATKQ